MSTNEQAKVALFIDWDNLAISTAADLGGANPDIKAIVQRAKQYGTVIIAKAYAEWQPNSDRLAVYRAGIEPAYAPTFRFEPDTPTQLGKGKSLADPCMVADCVDTLHLFPDISVYVLVTGDKDMIPVVRIAQMRGRRVVVIGPDYVAGILREMADEFIPYRSLVEGAPPRPEPTRRFSSAPPGEEGARRRDRQPTILRQEKISGLASQGQIPSVVAPMPSPPSAAIPSTPVKRAAISNEPLAEPAAEERHLDDLQSVFDSVRSILRHRREEGRDRVRATNLKDALMQRMPGFSERRYGFAKFKDLLTAAQKQGLLDVTVAGPVHWISLPSEPAEESLSAAPVESPTLEVKAIEAEINLPVVADRQGEMIRFLFDLRDRSKWLTYTYVLTNLISHFAKNLPQMAAESEARATLTNLMEQDIVRIDKEPQEVEVGGAKHRVRMCHLNTNHPAVTEVLGSRPEDAENSRVPQSAAADLPEGMQFEDFEAVPETTTLEHVESSVEDASRVTEPDSVVGGNGSLPHAFIQPTVEEHDEPGEGTSAPSKAADRPLQEMLKESAERGEQVTGEMEDQSEVFGDASGTPPAVAPLHQAFSALESILNEADQSQKPAMSASSARARLSRSLGSFDERALGFPRFKDFLKAAEQAGIIRLETRGHVNFVRKALNNPAT